MRTLEEYLKLVGPNAVLNLGCGKNNPEGCYGVDIMDLPGVDLVHDVNQGLPFPDQTFRVVLARDFLEHLKRENFPKVMEEIYRVLEDGGNLQFEVPSTDHGGRGAFQDPTHLGFYNEMTFWYFLDDQYGKGFRSLYDYKTWFQPDLLETRFNEWNVPYVRGVLRKGK